MTPAQNGEGPVPARDTIRPLPVIASARGQKGSLPTREAIQYGDSVHHEQTQHT